LFLLSILFLYGSCLYAQQNSDSFLYQKITVLTAPIGQHSAQYGGPASVTASLLNGFTRLGVHFNYNPSRIDEVGDVVIVLANAHALGQAIILKQSGHIKKLLAGPNLVVRAIDDGGILASPEIDICIVPSYWVKPSYEDDQPTLKNRIQIWYAGVDTNYWQPTSSLQQKIDAGEKNVLVYWKTENEAFCRDVEIALKKHGFHPIRLHYNHYAKEQYKTKLSKCLFSVFITRSESQGIAFAESWAMDVPTLVWDPQQPLVIRGKEHWPVAACPYLTNSTGILWKNITEFNVLLQNIRDHVSNFSPRSWIEKNMTDLVSASNMLKIIQNAPDASLLLPIDIAWKQ
jgi:hypothetical protein